jgi:hypothetical protein
MMSPLKFYPRKEWQKIRWERRSILVKDNNRFHEDFPEDDDEVNYEVRSPKRAR